MYSISNLSVHFGGEYLFEDVSFIINARDRIGLVGKNGAGKTTLLRLLTGEIRPEEGNIMIPSGRTIGYLPQQIRITSQSTVIEEARKAFKETLDLKAEIDAIGISISLRNDFETPAYHALIDRLHHLTERYQLLGGQSLDADVERTLTGLGFKSEEMDRPMQTFSGGWQMRVELAKILLRRPDLLLLDEPTNHLDIESIQWLEGFLTNYPGAVILVSHDRAFLDNITNRTIEITNGKVYDFKASYSDYVEQRQAMLEQQLATYSNQQREIAQIERFIERFRYKNTKARQVQSRIKMLEKMERVEIDDFDLSGIQFRFPPAPRSGRVVFEAHHLTKCYGDKLVIDNLDLSIERNDFVAFVGRNGEGKTTLSRIIVGELEHDGHARLGYEVRIGYYAQNQAELLNEEKTVFQTIDEVAMGDMRPKVRGLLGNFLFSGDDIEKKVKVLSGGERSRLALARMLLEPVNLLVLDEPTNHLDMRSKDILKNALLQYDGTLVIVSHDRDFLQGLTNKVFEFKDRKIRTWIGDIYDFLEARKLSHLSELERVTEQRNSSAPENPSAQKERREKKKDHERALRKIQTQLEKIEKRIAAVEAELAVMDLKLAEPEAWGPEVHSVLFYENYERLRKENESLMAEWAQAAEQLEAHQRNGEF